MKSTLKAPSSKKKIFFLEKSLFPFLFFILAGFLNQANGQSLLRITGNSAICNGTSTTLAVKVDGGYGPYTVVYNNGTSDFTVTGYKSNDTDGDDPITITPTSTKSYHLVSVTFGGGNSLPVDGAAVTVTVNPLPSEPNISTNPASPECPGVNFTLSASATNGNTYELWNQANTTKIGDIPYTGSINATTIYKVRAIGAQTLACTTTSADYTVTVDNVKPTLTNPGSQTLSTNSGDCKAVLPDYRSLATAHDNCTADISIVKTQTPAAGTELTGGHNSTQSVTIRSTDASGNYVDQTFTVTVKDNTNPRITGSAVSGNKNTDNGQCYYTVSGTEFDPTTTTDNCGLLRRTYKINSGTETGTNATTSLDLVHLAKGANIILWKAYDINGNTSTWTFTITVVDDQNPAITNLPADRDLNMSSTLCTAVLPSYISTLSITATDNCGSGGVVLTQSPAAGTILSGGHNSTQLITITATDASGKFSTGTFTVTVKDTQ
ncbi:MAG: hypothetical protein WCI31_17400, partial [Prolixibacteraceae bacterium]